MNFEINKIRADEIEISIKSIIEQIVRKIGLIIGCTILFAILVSALLYVRDISVYESIINDSVDSEEIELTMTDYIAIEKYELLSSKVEQLKEYEKNSTLMKIDYTKTVQGIMVYYVEADEIVKNAITLSVLDYVNNGFLAQDMSVNKNTEAGYMQEIISARHLTSGQEDNSGLIVINVKSINDKDCKVYMDMLKVCISNFAKGLEEKIGNNRLVIVEERIATSKREEVYVAQVGFWEELRIADSDLSAHISTLTPVQKMNILDFKDEIIQPTIAEPGISVKNIIIGAILGMLIGLVIILGMIILGGKLQSERELSKRFNINHLGNIRFVRNTFTERLITKVLYKGIDMNIDSQLKMVISRILLYLENADNKKICIVGTSRLIDNATFEILIKELKEKGISCDIVGNVVKNHEAIEKLSENENIVLVESIGKSKVKDIYEEAMMCVNAKLNVVGYISVQE